MASITIKGFAEQIGVEPTTLLKQLESAGVEGKKVGDSLDDDEKLTLLTFLALRRSVSTPPPQLFISPFSARTK